MTHRGFTVGGELVELAVRLRRAPQNAASVEAERTVELHRERLRQQRMDQERIEAELRRSVELERQRMEREGAEKARVVERGAMLNAEGGSVDASSYRRCGAAAARECRGGEKAGADPSGMA